MMTFTDLGVFDSADLMFRVDDRGYQVGDIISAGRWGSIVAEWGVRHDQYARETLLEKIRAAEFPEKPSRLTSSFAFKYFNDADGFHEHRWNEGSKQWLYSVVPADLSAPRHQAHMSCLPPIPEASDEDVARAYWSGDRYAFNRDFYKMGPTEILVACPFRVVMVNSQVDNATQA